MNVGGFRWNVRLVNCKTRFLFSISRGSAIITQVASSGYTLYALISVQITAQHNV